MSKKIEIINVWLLFVIKILINMSSHVSSFLGELGITGNPVLDGLILANLIPIVITYANTVSSVFLKLISFLWQILLYQVKMYLQGKMIGENLSIIILRNDNIMFTYIKELIFDSDVESDKIAKSNVINAMEYIKLSNSDKPQFKKWSDKWKKTIELDLQYNDESLFKHGNVYKHTTNKIYKYFKYNEYIVVIIYNEKEDGKSFIKIKIMYFGTNKDILSDWNGKKSSKLIEDFLRDKFNFTKKINYTYTLNITNVHLRNKLYNYISRGYICTSSGLLKYGTSTCTNKNNPNDKKMLAEKQMILSVDESNFNSTNTNYKDLINLIPICQSDSKTSSGFISLCKKYGITYKNQVYGYFYIDTTIVMLYSGSSSSYIDCITLISPNELLTVDQIEKLVEWVINDCIASNSVNTTKRAQRLIHRRDNGAWNSYSMDIRSFDTMYLPKNTFCDIKTEIENFIKKEKLYREYQIPYKKGILFYGPPGTGKTSLVKAISYEFQMDIYMININDEEINDESIIDIINAISTQDKKILLFEDIDSAFADKEKLAHEIKLDDVNKNIHVCEKDINGKEKEHDDKNVLQQGNNNNQIKRKYLTYSGLLNALDGVMSNQHGVITIMTTNYIGKLGDALLRPGRIDKKIELKECNHEQITMMMNSLIAKYQKISINDERFVKYDINSKEELDAKIDNFANILTNDENMSKIKPCQLQFYILKYIDNLELLFTNYYELDI